MSYCRDRISVILPTFNRANYLAAALDSVVAQSAPIHDIVVVDDGSIDETADVVARYSPRVAYIHQVNAGKIAAIRRGLKFTEGDLVWIMDDDDIAPRGALEALATPLWRDPHLSYSYGHLVKFTAAPGGGRIERERSSYPVDDKRPFLLKMMEDCFITGHPCVLARRSAIEFSFSHEQRVMSSADYFFFLNMALTGPVAAVDEVVLHQRQHDGERGPSAQRYGERERVERWKASDRALIISLLDRLPLEAFYPGTKPSAAFSTLEQRAALLQRASIEARKQIWDRALVDLDVAFRIEPRIALTQIEMAILPRLLGCRYGVPEVYAQPEILRRLREIIQTRQSEDEIAGQIGRPLLYLAKNGAMDRSLGAISDATRAWLSLMDVRSGLTAVRTTGTRLLSRTGKKPPRQYGVAGPSPSTTEQQEPQ